MCFKGIAIMIGTPVIIDTDMALDDWMAILYLLKEPKVDVKAITVAGTGIVHGEAGIKNALGLLTLAQRDSIPVASGRELPLQGNNSCVGFFRKMMDRTLWVPLPSPLHPGVIFPDTLKLFKQLIENATSKITILSIGPLTNIAELIQTYPQLVEHIDRIYFMGGAISVPGNVFPTTFHYNKAGEFNIYMDPLAAYTVFHSGIPITLVPLDITNTVPADMEFLRELKKYRSLNPIISFIYKTLSKFSIAIWFKQYFLYDPLAAVIISHPEIYTTRTTLLDISLTPGKNLGQTYPSKNGVEIDVVDKVNVEKCKQLLLDSYRQ